MTATIASGPGFADAYREIDPVKPDYDRIRDITAGLVPFGSHAGVRVTEIGPDEAVVEIPDEPHLRNHLGTVHAGALFLAADIAGASAFLGAVAPRLRDVRWFVLKEARTSFRKPAAGRVRVVGTVEERAVRGLLRATEEQRFEVDGKALLYTANGTLVGKVSFEYVCEVAAPVQAASHGSSR
jgi:acyl-coenzyme A thioesterase PaaI-like protein